MSTRNGSVALARPSCLDAALDYVAAGIPITICRGKNPGVVSAWQDKRWTEPEIENCFRREPELNVGFILGVASGLVDLECDTRTAETDYANLFDNEPPVAPTYTSARGRHRLFRHHPRLETIANLPGFDNAEKGGAVVKFGELECRIGVGGKAAQSLVPPSTTNGVPKEWLPGLSLSDCDPPELPEVVVDRIIAAAAAKFKKQAIPTDAEGRSLGGRPGDDFNAKATWADILQLHGWMVEHVSHGVTYWRRPGKKDGWSATTGFCSNHTSGDLLYVFSTNAGPFESERAYSRFAVYALLNFGGSFADAATALASQGYGDCELSLWKAQGRTDLANARWFAEIHGENLRYVPDWKKWLTWDGKRWAQDRLLTVEQWGKDVPHRMWDETAEAGKKDDAPKGLLKEMARWAAYTASKKGQTAMLALAASDPKIAVVPELFDTDPWALTVENGTIDLQSGTLRDHRREDYITKLAPVSFDTRADCPLWRRFLREVFEHSNKDKEAGLIRFIQKAAGYSATGITNERCLIFLVGKGRNGKTTLVTRLAKVLGDYSVAITSEMLMVNTKQQIPTEVCDLIGARLAVASETEDGKKFAESFVKTLCGGEDKLKGRRLYQNFSQFAATAKLWISGNHKPRVSGNDDAIWDRFRLVPFNKRFDTPDKELAEKLLAEAPGILNWIVTGSLLWQKEGLNEPDEVKAATGRYRDENDVVGEFIRHRCEVSGELRIRSAELYSAFKNWAHDAGENVLSLTKFGAAIADRGFEKSTSNGIWYHGIKIRPIYNRGEELD
jgi:P4 family phage/plasmid primase-like protien